MNVKSSKQKLRRAVEAEVDLKDIERNPYGDGWGELILEKIVTTDSDGVEQVLERGFFRIPEFQRVLNLLHELKDKALAKTM